MKLSSSNIKRFLIFSQKKAALIFQETEALKKISHISGSGNFLNFRIAQPFRIFQEVTFRAQKVKKKTLLKRFLYFRKWNFLVPSLKAHSQL